VAARLHRKAAYTALVRHDVAASTPHLAAAAALVDGLPESVEWGRVRLVRALWHWEQGQHAEGRRAADESLTFARQRGEGMDLINAYMTLALVFHSSGEWKEGLEIEIRHLGSTADTDARLGLLFDAHACLGEYHLYGNTSIEEIECYARRTLDLAIRMGARRAQGLSLLLVGGALSIRGRWEEAEECLRRSLDLQAAVGSAAGQALALQRLAELSVHRGDHQTAGDLLRRAWDLPIDAPMAPHVYGRLYATEARRALEGGDPAAAIRTLEMAADAAARAGDCATCSALLHPVGTEAYAALGNRERAEQRASEAARAAAHWESGAWRAMAEMSHAVARLSSGSAACAADHFLSAAASFERIGQPYEMARCLLMGSQAKAQCGAVEEARRLAGCALGVFEALGASGAAARAREQRAALGSGPEGEVPERREGIMKSQGSARQVGPPNLGA
jgi:tetratricopeptide (TPR) repeat protein